MARWCLILRRGRPRETMRDLRHAVPLLMRNQERVQALVAAAVSDI